MLDSPHYPHERIYTVKVLARALRTDESTLRRVSARANHMYIDLPGERKPDGGYRHYCDTAPALKALLRTTNDVLLSRVKYPDYLQGSLKGKDYKRNAELHVGARVVATLDIQKFFPSTDASSVNAVWRGVFGFGEDVAAVLTELTCRDGYLKEGAPTSSYLANLIFWRYEPQLVVRLREQGITYSRLVDDIFLSTRTDVSNDVLSQAISDVITMMRKMGYKTKRTKQKVMRANSQIVLTNLVANKKASLPPKERSRIRAIAHQTAVSVRAGATAQDLRSPLGQLYKLKRFHPNLGIPLLRMLKTTAPSL